MCTEAMLASMASLRSVVIRWLQADHSETELKKKRFVFPSSASATLYAPCTENLSAYETITMVRKGQYNYGDFDQTGRIGPSKKLLSMLLDHPNSGSYNTELLVVTQAGPELLQDLAVLTEVCKVHHCLFDRKLQHLSNQQTALTTGGTGGNGVFNRLGNNQNSFQALADAPAPGRIAFGGRGTQSQRDGNHATQSSAGHRGSADKQQGRYKRPNKLNARSHVAKPLS